MVARTVIRYRVTCQDALGHACEIDVQAETDEKACALALAELNSWRAVLALQEIGTGTAPRGADSHTATRLVAVPDPDAVRPVEAAEGVSGRADEVPPSPSPTSEYPPDPIVIETGGKPIRRGNGPHIVHKAGPRDWIDRRATPKTNVGRALLAAAQQQERAA